MTAAKRPRAATASPSGLGAGSGVGLGSGSGLGAGSGVGLGLGSGARLGACRIGGRFAAWLAVAWLAAGVWLVAPGPAYASDHLDTPTVIADPSADIGDLFAWTSADGKQLNLAMTVVAHAFSDRLLYAFHVDSGPAYGATSTTTTILCRFAVANSAECWAGDADYVRGDASQPGGLVGRRGRFRVFAGLRDDPFANNVKGTRAALNVAAAALRGGAPADAAGCPRFGEATTHAIADQWRQTDGGPGKNFLAGWTSSALVVSIDLDVVTAGGPLVAVRAETSKPEPARSSIDAKHGRSQDANTTTPGGAR